MKALSLTVHKLWPRLIFLSTDDEDDNNNDDVQRRVYDNSSPDFWHGELKTSPTTSITRRLRTEFERINYGNLYWYDY